MTKPVTVRTTCASARDKGSPASAAALSGSTRLPPAVTNRNSPPWTPWKSRDFTIWSRVTSASAAAASAVRISPFAATGTEAIPAARSAAVTRASDFDLRGSLFPPDKRQREACQRLTAFPRRRKVRA